MERLSLKEFFICPTRASGLPGSPDPSLMGVSGCQAGAEDFWLWILHGGTLGISVDPGGRVWGLGSTLAVWKLGGKGRNKPREWTD